MIKTHYIIPIFVPHEGCPHNCVFCNQNSITGSTSRIDDVFVRDTVEEYLRTIKNRDAIVEISFFGGTFTAIDTEKQKQLLKVAKEFKEAGKINYIRLSTRPDYINNYILDYLKEYSVDIIELGIQSLDQEVLKASGRGHSEQDVIEASNLIKQYGFVLGHQIMLGLPKDNFQKDIDTVKKVIKLSPNICRIYPALVIKNTPMEEMFAKGIYKPYSLDDAIEISKEIYGLLIVNDIKVIRIGLQPTEEINEGKEIVTGPFHPSFRELVEGKIFNEMWRSLVPDGYEGEVIIKVNSRDISKLYSNKKNIFNDSKKQLKTINVKVIQDDSIERDSVAVKLSNIYRSMSIYTHMLKKFKEGNYSFL